MQKRHELRNNFFLLKNVLFIKKKDVRDMRATFILIKMAVIVIFTLCKWILYLCAVSMIYGARNNPVDLIFGGTIALVFWIFARIFRIASFEVDKMEDGNLFIAIFSGALSFVAVVIAIITIIIDKV